MRHVPKKESSDTDVSLKKRRKRTAFSHTQQAKLENAFQKDHWPTRNRKERLALELDMSLQSVRTWFQNRRAKEKREEDYKEMQAGKQKTEKKPSLASGKIISQSQPKVKGESIKFAASGSPARLFSTSHGFMTRSKLKKQVRVRELQQSERATTSGSDVSERTTDEEASTAEDEGDAEDEEEGVDGEKSCTEQSSDSCVDETAVNIDDGNKPLSASKGYVKPCQTEVSLLNHNCSVCVFLIIQRLRFINSL